MNGGTGWIVAMLLRAVFAAVLGFTVALPGVALGAPATPTPFDVDPSQCTAQPRTLDELERLIGSATPIPYSGRPVSGDPIDPSSDDGRAVISTIEMLFACLNAGDTLRAYGLSTDSYLASILRPGNLPAIATPIAVDPDEYTRIISIDLHALAGGGVIATVTLDPALIPVHKIFEFVLIPVDGGWRIDRAIDEINFSLP